MATEQLKTILKKDVVTERDYIIIDGKKVYVWFDFYDDGYKDGNIIQNFIMSYIEIEYDDIDIDFKGKELKAYKEYKIDNDNWESVFLNTFIVTDAEPDDTKRITTVKAYDYGLKYATTYESELLYSSGAVTLQDVSDEINTKLGMNLAEIDINKNFIVDSNQFPNTLYGSVISAIAGATGNRAKIVQDKLEYQFKKDSGIVLSLDDYEDLEDKRDTRPITCLEIGSSFAEGNNVTVKDDVLVSLYGENWLKIIDNPFAYTQAKKADLINEIFDKIKGFGYSSFVATNTMLPYARVGDLIKFENQDGEIIDSIVLRQEMKSTEINLEAPSVTDSSVAYETPVDAIDVAKRAEIIVNNQTGTITQIVEEQTKQEQKLSIIEQDIDLIEQKLQNISDYTDSGNFFDFVHLTGTIGGTTNPEQYGYILDFKIYGHPRFEYLYPEEELYPSEDLYPIDDIPQIIVSDKPKGDMTGNWKLIDLNITEPLYSMIVGSEVIRDEFYIKTVDGVVTATLTKRIERLSDGTLQLLTVPIVQNVGEVLLPTYADDTYLYVNGIDDLEYYARWLLENDYSGVFATKVELTTSIQQTTESILLEVDREITTVNGEIIKANSKIDQTADEINLEVTRIDGELEETNSKITQTADEINLEVAKKVGNDEVISKINQSAEAISISANKVDINGVVNIMNGGTTTKINGNSIETGSITADKVSSDIITTTNFSAQNINADRITAGTLSAGAINLRGTYLSPTYSTLAGFELSNGSIGNDNFSVDTNGNLNVISQTGSGGKLIVNNGVRIEGSAGVVIGSNSNLNTTFPSGNGINIIGASGATVYMGCKYGTSGTGTERSAVGCDESNLQLRAIGTISANGSQIGGSSSRATKKNIKKLSDLKKKELYDTIRNVELKEYDYKKQYGKPKNYGFIIEEIEDTILNDILHIVQNENDKNIKVYCSEDLTRVNLIMIQELMKKVETLENEIKKLKEVKK